MSSMRSGSCYVSVSYRRAMKIAVSLLARKAWMFGCCASCSISYMTMLRWGSEGGVRARVSAWLSRFIWEGC
jgi:hypothetical protein